MHGYLDFERSLYRRFYSSVTSSTRAVRSRFTVPDVSGASVAVVEAEGAASFPFSAAVGAGSALAFLLFFFLVCNAVSTLDGGKG